MKAFIFFVTLAILVVLVMATAEAVRVADEPSDDLMERIVSKCDWCNALNNGYCCGIGGPCCRKQKHFFSGLRFPLTFPPIIISHPSIVIMACFVTISTCHILTSAFFLVQIH